MTNWLVTGAGGMLGSDVVAVLRHAGEPVIAATRLELDITDPRAVDAAVHAASSLSPGADTVIVNAAAWTDVDAAETFEDRATEVNGTAVAHLARACREAGARLVQVSTDYVFDGTSATPYGEDTPPCPVNAYGRSKLAGERAVQDILPDSGYVVRTAWLYGAHGGNFVSTMLRLANERDTVDVVDDQIGQPTAAWDLANTIVHLGRSGARGGIYHGTASGQTTWFGLARAVFAEAGHDPDRVRPTSSAAFRRPAARPAYSVLGHEGWAGTGVPVMTDWRGMLSRAFADGNLLTTGQEV